MATDARHRSGQIVDGDASLGVPQAMRVAGFESVLAGVRSDWGRSLGLRSVDSDLNGQMFKPTPRDARSQRESIQREEQLSRDANHARSELARSIDQPFIATQQPVTAGSVAFDQSDTQESAVKSAPTESSAPTVPHSTRSTLAQPGHGLASSLNGNREGNGPSQLPSQGVAQTGLTPAVQGVIADSGSVSGSRAVQAVGATSAANASTAQQVAKFLQSGSITDIVAHRTSPSSQAVAEPRDQQAIQDQAKEQPSMRDGASVGKSKEAGRTSEPSPFDEIVRSIKMRAGPDFSSARIRLDPPELGQVRVDVRLDGDRIQLGIQTESAEAADRVQQGVKELKAALEHHGIKFGAGDVRVEVAGDSETGNPIDLMNRSASDGASQHGTSWASDHSRRTFWDSVGPHSASFEVDPQVFWGGAQWFNVAEGRVDVRI